MADLVIETPWAVTCFNHGKVFLSQRQDRSQLLRSNDLWRCPHCGETAPWDDDNYDDYQDAAEARRENEKR